MKGSVEITKVYSDGRKELVCRDNNVLTTGLGVSLVDLFTETGSTDIKDKIAGYFQIGVGKHQPENQSDSASKYISSLASPLTTSEEYGVDASLDVNIHNLVTLHPTVFNGAIQQGTQEAVFVKLENSDSVNNINGVVSYKLVLTEEMANDLNGEITEFGLFTRNTTEAAFSSKQRPQDHKSVLLAYKNLEGVAGSGIEKNSDYSLVVDWQLKFVDDSAVAEVRPAAPGRPNVVFIMIDDVGVDQLGMYDSLNPYKLGENGTHANAVPFSQLDDPTNGSGIYPHTPTLSALADAGMTFFNTRSQPACTPTRGTFLTGKYNFSCQNFQPLETGGFIPNTGFWGPGLGIVPDANWLRRSRGGLRGLNDPYRIINQQGYKQSLQNGITDGNGNPNFIPQNAVFADYMKKDDVGYNSSLFGKWHLAAWSDQQVYCEEGIDDTQQQNIKGRGWSHIGIKGKWDHYVATFSNLNVPPIPGYNAVTNVWENASQWPNKGGSTTDSTDGKQMGFVNFFANYNGDILTVSDTGYRTYKEVGPSVPYEQGDASSFATNFILSAASSHFNTATEPFFMYISPNMPHTPYTYPPSSNVYNSYYNQNDRYSVLQRGTDANTSTSATWIATNAMIENFDKTLSGFLANLDQSRRDNTVFIFTSDNGGVLTDQRKRAVFASSLGLGAGTSLGGDYNGSGGFGSTYDKMLNLGAYCSSLTPSAVRRGGENDSANQFKASLYDRGVLVPMIVSGPGISAGVQTSALVDLTDMLATVVDFAGGDFNSFPAVPTDSVSFKDVLLGVTNSSSHGRQFSFSEVFFPNGNSIGTVSDSGTYTGYAGCPNPIAINSVEGVEDPNPFFPRRVRRGLSVRFSPSQFIGFNPPKLGAVIEDLITEGVIDAGDVTAVYDEIPDASAGLWKIIRPGSGRVNFGADFPHDTQESTATPNFPHTLGLGRLYEELYHLQKLDFDAVDPYELKDFIDEETKGIKNGYCASALFVSAIVNSTGNGGINKSGQLNNTVHYYNVGRIYEAIRLALGSFLQYRYTPTQTMNLLGGQDMWDPEDENNEAIQ
jgi:arylsulfatase A-like enzyme|tara:strand:+ start:27418 stop:30579 length:3162 start_codon:yes stop_codon:yes gene_type:complete